MGSSVLSQLRKKNRYVKRTFIKNKETNERPISLTKNKTSSKPETKQEVSYTPPLLLEKTKIPDNKTTQDTTSTTPTTKGFANKLALFLKDVKSYKEWEQFPQLVEDIRTNSRNNILRGITDDITDDIICEKLISLLNSSPIKTLKNIKSVLVEIHITTYDLYTQFYISWVVIGCPGSTDIDVVVFVTKENIKDGKPLELSPTLLITLMTELRDARYSIESIDDLDINVLCVNEEGHIIANAKGGAEIANIINTTHQYHKQKYPIHYLQTIEVSIFDKLRAISKFILDKLKNLTQDYEKIRSSKQEAYQNGTDAMILFTVSEDFLGNLDLVNINNTKEWKDLWKSLTMKFCQLILLVNKQYEYTKEQLAKKTGKLFPELENLTDELLWFLFRGNKGRIDIDNTEDTIRFLHQKYCEIVTNHFESVKPTYMTITKDTLLDTIIEQELHFPEDLLKAFFESPNVPTSTFEKLWDEFVLLYKEVYNVSSFSLNKLFQTPVSSLDDRLKLFTLLGKTNYEQFVWIAQRSDEWFALRKLYPGGTDLGNIGETLQAIYNLIRGSITEMIIQELFSPSVIGLKNEAYRWLDTGLIHNAKKSCAPDGLLVSSTDIIPVEIKSLHSSVRNSDYYRGIKLATKQCNSVRTILNRPDVITHYLVILSWYKPDGSLELELHYKEF